MISEKNILKLEKRRKIYDFIDKYPGLNVREISRKLNIPLTSLTYHLKYLKKLDLIKESREGKYKKIFISYKMGAEDKKILSLLRNENSSKILFYLFLFLSCSQIEISRELNIPPPTVSYYLKKMVDMEIIEEIPVVNGRIYPFPKESRYIERKPHKSEKFYRRKNQQVVDTFFRLMLAHKSSLKNQEIIDILIDIWQTYKAARGSDPIEKFVKIDDQINNIVGLLYDYFRPPFCA